jgi:hypothetical protein
MTPLQRISVSTALFADWLRAYWPLIAIAFLLGFVGGLAISFAPVQP